MQVIFLDGESKSGKTAVGRSIQNALTARGHNVRLLVAGNFFRQLTLEVLDKLPASVTFGTEEFEAAVRVALHADVLLLPPEDPSVLESDAVEGLVSQIGQLSFVQEAAADWRLASAQKALEDGVEILLFDGRNLRQKLSGWAQEAQALVALELIIYCRPEVAAARYLADEHTESSGAALTQATATIQKRRADDRNRAHAAYADAIDPVELVVGTHTVDDALAAAWSQDVAHPPRPIRFDNSEVPREDGLRTVTELAEKAIARLKVI